ncbi:putative membrane protein [Maribacter vaceletii]|uniref:Putative membrane protein n=1 Tax=Maribacter vaceletii TaxID=1206816 RepID=A0A495EBQ0_9FLAO|nr:c-type cytochrome domain-containing protein [Maribacter vaceletii]RKR14314.1 putative membrane protein [Maribacter vaceletii]
MDQAPDIVLFLGRFHPLIVHMPIGFLFFAFLLEVFSKWKKNNALLAGIPLALLMGAITATISCILGYMLSLSGDYEESAVDSHFWFGIATTIVAFVAWLIRIDKIKLPTGSNFKSNIATLTLLVILLSITGHYGGNLTHGSDYLVKYLPFGKEEKKELVAITKVEDAVVYDYLVEPILDNKCTSCHNSSKKKGGLSLIDSTSISKGGKNGDALIVGNSAKSEMIKRVLLDPHNDDFMPPEGKTPLTEEEIAILTYWIDNANASYSSKVTSIETPENITHIASNMLDIPIEGQKGATKLPTVSTINEEVISTVTAQGFTLRELVFESSLYEVVLPPKSTKNSTPEEIAKKIESLSNIKDNILWFYADDNGITDKHLTQISGFKNLQKLSLNNNAISDKGISFLENLNSLNSLNIYNTQASKNSLNTFLKMKNLEHVYAWKTSIKEEDLESFKEKENAPSISLGN